MSWVKAILLVIQLTSKLANYLHDRQKLNDGETQAVARALGEVAQRIEKARLARRVARVRGMSDDDPYRRD